MLQFEFSLFVSLLCTSTDYGYFLTLLSFCCSNITIITSGIGICYNNKARSTHFIVDIINNIHNTMLRFEFSLFVSLVCKSTDL